MDTRELIISRLRDRLQAVYVEVEDESHRHAGHAGAKGGGGHFDVTVVTQEFEGKPLVTRHRMVYGLFQEELKQAIHALALHTWTPSEWEARTSR